MSTDGVRVTHAHGDDHGIYARMTAPLIGTIIQLDYRDPEHGERTHPAVIVTAVDDHGISYVTYDGDDLDVIGWDVAAELLDQHPALHTIVTTPWDAVATIHVW